MKAYKGSGGMAPLILHLAPRWRSEVNSNRKDSHPATYKFIDPIDIPPNLA